MCSKTIYPPPPSPPPVAAPIAPIKASAIRDGKSAVSDPKGKKKPTSSTTASGRRTLMTKKAASTSTGVTVGGVGGSGLSIPK